MDQSLVPWIVVIQSGDESRNPRAWTLAIADGGWFVLSTQELGDPSARCSILVDMTESAGSWGVTPTSSPVAVLASVLATCDCHGKAQAEMVRLAKRALPRAFDFTTRRIAGRALAERRAA